MFARFMKGKKSPSKGDDEKTEQQLHDSSGSSSIVAPAAQSNHKLNSITVNSEISKATSPSSTLIGTNTISPLIKPWAKVSDIVTIPNKTISTQIHPQVLYCDAYNTWAPLSQQYFSSSSNKLISISGNATVQEIVSFYCPSCVTRFMEDEVNAYKNTCPHCKECPHCSAPLSIASSANSGYYYECGYCSWTSLSVQGTDKTNLETYVDNKYREKSHEDEFKVLLDVYNVPRKKTAPYIKRPSRTEQWGVAEIEGKLNRGRSMDPTGESKLYAHMNTAPYNTQSRYVPDIAIIKSTDMITSLEQRMKCVDLAPILVTDLLPLPIKLRTKRMIRSRDDVLSGAQSILLQPKAFPLEGDSTQKLQKGKWFVKNSCAYNTVPSFIVRKLPDTSALLRGESSHIYINITNPKESSISLSVRQASREEIIAKQSNSDNFPDPISLIASPPDMLISIGPYEDEVLLPADVIKSLRSATLPTPLMNAMEWSIHSTANISTLCIPVSVDKEIGNLTQDKSSVATFQLAFNIIFSDVSNSQRNMDLESIFLRICF